ncbi:MAG: hypothetical protein BWY63_00218 [Chloroflexi bacterium ADurb.Bin360]|mgnify:CR=1 FL=1|nr:MAG: hypothetical protein BWY63_00218 [Chloroflexi bacterium ADurb.Bin360]
MERQQQLLRRSSDKQMSLKQILGALLALISPLALITFLIGCLVVLDKFGAHLGQLRRLERDGRVTEAVVDFASPDYDWVFVDYHDGAEERSGVLEMRYYPAETWALMRPGATITIRYLPFAERGSDRVALVDRFDDLRSYRGYLQSDALILLGLSWAVFLFKPQLLYVGLVDGNLLGDEALNS